MPTIALLVPSLMFVVQGHTAMEKKIVVDAKKRICEKFDLKKLKVSVQRTEIEYEVEFFPKDRTKIGNGVILYYSHDGEFKKMLYTQ